jgi:hypothetical protein
VHALVADAIDRSVRFAGDTDIEGLCGLLVYMVIRRRVGNAAASTGLWGPSANFIGVGESEKIESVAAKMMGKDKPGGLLVYRRYEP